MAYLGGRTVDKYERIHCKNMHGICAHLRKWESCKYGQNGGQKWNKATDWQCFVLMR